MTMSMVKADEKIWDFKEWAWWAPQKSDFNFLRLSQRTTKWWRRLKSRLSGENKPGHFTQKWQVLRRNMQRLDACLIPSSSNRDDWTAEASGSPLSRRPGGCTDPITQPRIRTKRGAAGLSTFSSTFTYERPSRFGSRYHAELSMMRSNEYFTLSSSKGSSTSLRRRQISTELLLRQHSELGFFGGRPKRLALRAGFRFSWQKCHSRD